MWRWLWMLVACGAPTAAPPSGPPSPASTAPPVSVDAAVYDAPPLEVERSSELGPIIDSLPKHGVLQDHELTLSTDSDRITLVGPRSIEVAPLDDPARRVAAPDGTWAVEQNFKTHEIVMVGGNVAKPVVVHRGSTLIRFVGGLERQRTVVLDRGNWGWFVVRSQDGGTKWTETKHDIVGSSIEASRRTFDLVTRDGDWIRIDRDGDVTTVPLIERGVEPGPYSCASTSLWVPQGKRLLWFDGKRRGSVAVAARGQMICAGDAVLVPVEGGLTRCTHSGCGEVIPAGTFSDLTATGIATATQSGTSVRVTRTDRGAVDVHLRDREQLGGMVVWNDVPTLVLVRAGRRLVLAPVP